VKNPLLASLAVLSLSSAGLAACSGSDSPGTTATSGGGGSPSTTTTTSSDSSSTSTSTSSTSTTGAGGSSGACTETKFGDDRPVQLHVPPSYSCDKAAPLVILLHGYSVNSSFQETYLGITAESNKRGFLYAHPDGTKDGMNNPFWNATDACCNFYGSKIDDSAYISKIITDVQAAYNVDAKRIYLIGHSNGGFMSYRMACEHGDQIAAIASLAGAMYQDVAKCPAADPVSVLQIHGTTDSVIAYNGGSLPNMVTFPSAATSVGDWVTFNKCEATADTSATPLDLESTLAGNETTITSYTGCQSGTGVTLWTIPGGSHIPTFTANFIPGVLDFLYAHPKP
jgi:polyhydroxybutyrate depolymerase